MTIIYRTYKGTKVKSTTYYIESVSRELKDLLCTKKKPAPCTQQTTVDDPLCAESVQNVQNELFFRTS